MSRALHVHAFHVQEKPQVPAVCQPSQAVEQLLLEPLETTHTGYPTATSSDGINTRANVNRVLEDARLVGAVPDIERCRSISILRC
jgi:hypothetical protein